MSLYSVSTVSDLTSAFRTAQDGDIIELAAGSYGATLLSNKSFATGITIRSADPNNPATFTETLKVFRVDNLDIENIEIIGGSLAGRSSTPRLFVDIASGITVKDIVIEGYIPTAAEGVDPASGTAKRGDPLTGYGYDLGIRINRAQDIEILNPDISAARSGFYIGKTDGLLIEGGTLTELREGINFFDTSNLTITKSSFSDFKPWLPFSDPAYDRNIHDHPDMIQYWGANSSDGVHHITITDNHFEMPPGGATQTIFGNLNTATNPVTATDFTVTGNTILNGHPNAIRLGDIDGGLIADNVLLPNSTGVDKYHAPTIELLGATNVDVVNNTFVAWNQGFILDWTDAELAAAGITLTGNTLLSTDPASPDYWGDWQAGTAPPELGTTGAQLLASAVLSLEEGDDYSNLGGTSEINTGSYTEKTTSLTFTTSSDVTSLQVLYEQGGRVKGLNIFIENGVLKASIWNGSDYDLVETPITALSHHSVSFVFSGGQGSASTIQLWLDGVLRDSAASFDTLERHTQSGAAGEVYQTTIINGVETADTLDGSDPLAFTGFIHAVTQHNEALNAAEIAALAAVLPAGDGSLPSTPPPTTSSLGDQLLALAVLSLEEGDNYSNLGGTSEINTGSYTEKTTSLTFTTSNDVTSLQVLYEQGGGVKGFNIFIENGFLKASIWNGSDYDLVETPITALAHHSVAFVFSGGQGSASSIGLWLDGVLCDTAASFDTLTRHTQSGAAGEVYQTTIINGVETADTLQGGDPLAFTGTIHAVTQHNEALGAAEIEALAVVLPADSAASAAPAASQLAVFDTEVDEIEFLAAAQTGTGTDADLETGLDTGLESDLDLAAELAHLTQTADPYDLWA